MSMFFGLKRPDALVKLLLAVLGLGFLFRERLSEDDRKKLKHKAHLFRHKLNDALDIWDTNNEEPPTAE